MPRPANPNKFTTLTCLECSKEFQKETKEVKRRVKAGKTEFFCGISCSTAYRMRVTGVTYPPVEAICPTCGREFTTTSAPKAPKHCSRSCANTTRPREATPGRVAAGLAHADNLLGVHVLAASLRSREGWNYQGMVTVLTQLGVSHTFEFPLDPYVYDLALHDTKTLVEFDGPDHTYSTEVQALDALKTQHAHQLGWKLERIAVEPAAPIPPSKIRHLL